MVLTEQGLISNSYPVEASGWDIAHIFFVEKSELEWKEESGKYLTLSHSLSPGSMIFLRLLQTTSLDRSLSVAYRTQHVGVTPEGQQQFRLKQVQPNCDLIDKEK
jgi:hypothetical protein